MSGKLSTWSHAPSRADIRLVMEDETKSMSDAIGMAMIAMRWGWTMADHEVVSSLAYLATHPHLKARIMADRELSIELVLEEMHINVDVSGVALTPIAVPDEAIKWILRAGNQEECSKRAADLALPVWIDALLEHVRRRTECGEVLQYSLLSTDKVAA